MVSSFRKQMTVYRPATLGLVDGYWQRNGLPTTFNIYASLQPASGKDLQSLPDGRREAGGYVIYTSTQLNMVDNELTELSNPDFFVIDGDQYEVVTAMPWQNNVINHYQYIIQKTEKPIPLT